VSKETPVFVCLPFWIFTDKKANVGVTSDLSVFLSAPERNNLAAIVVEINLTFYVKL
jgi:hypothetical protein